MHRDHFPATVGDVMAEPQHVRMADTGWQAWRWALVRSAGFAADGLSRLSAPQCAAAAEAYLAAGDTQLAAFDSAYDKAVRDVAVAVHEIASDSRFRMAMTWQNPDAMVAVSGILRDGPQAPRNSRRRSREEIVAKYWQRYCGKNDTVGFFGPMCWVRLEPDGPALAGGPGPALIRRQRVFFERWTLAAFAAWLAEDDRIRPYLPVLTQPHLSFSEATVHHPQRGALRLLPAEAAVYECCDGSDARDIAGRLVAGKAQGFRTEADVYTMIDQLSSRGLLCWGIDLPMDLTAEEVLLARLSGIGDPMIRQRAQRMFQRLRDRRDEVAAAEDPGALAAAMAALDREFTEITGRSPRQRSGETQAGRTLCHLEAERDADLSFGAAVLAKLAPLEPLLVSARWLTAELAEAYRQAFTSFYQEAVAATGSAVVPFDHVWYPAFDALVGADRPADAVIAEYLRRWSEVLGLATVIPNQRRLELKTADLLAKAEAAFPASAAGWSLARIHTPDVHICAESADAVRAGDFDIVLGELHVGVPGFDTHFFAVGHPAPAELIETMRQDMPVSRVTIATPDGWPRTTAREAEWLTGPTDVQLAFAPSAGIDRTRSLPVSALTVVPGADGLTVCAPDGRSWPLIEMFVGLLWLHTFDTWKLAGSSGHTPRVLVDGLVLLRETWRTTAAESGLADVSGERERYLAVRRWRRSLGLPEQIFIRFESETKPCYFDLSSPVYVRVLCNMVKSARNRAGEQAALTISEMLPGAADAWLPDAEGRRYSSELRIQFCDPRPAATYPVRHQQV